MNELFLQKVYEWDWNKVKFDAVTKFDDEKAFRWPVCTMIDELRLCWVETSSKFGAILLRTVTLLVKHWNNERYSRQARAQGAFNNS